MLTLCQIIYEQFQTSQSSKRQDFLLPIRLNYCQLSHFCERQSVIKLINRVRLDFDDIINTSEIKGMQGFKNLMRANLYTQEALQYFSKRLQEVRKITNGPLDQCESLVVINESNTSLLQKWLTEYQNCEVEQLKKSLFLSALFQVYKKLVSYQKQFASQLRNYFVEITREIKNNSIIQLQQSLELIGKVRSYRSKEQAMLQNHKKFTKLHKAMIGNIEAYKKTFTDVKMIYNKEEKIKRYSLCESTYADMMEEYNQIGEKLTSMTQNKKELLQSFAKYVDLTGSSLQNVGGKLLGVQNMFLQFLYQRETNCINIFTSQIQKLQKMDLEIEFKYPTTDNESEQYLTAGKEREKHKFIPSIIMNYLIIKPSHYLHLGVLLVNFQKELSECIRQRRVYGKQILEYFGQFSKAYEKISNMSKQFVSGFEKRKKKFVELYGVNSYFIPAFTKTIQCMESIQEKNVKIFNTKYKMVEKLVEEEAKLLDTLQKDFKVYCIEKFMGKKDIKRKPSQQKGYVQSQIEARKSENEFIRLQTLQKMGSLKLLFETAYEKLKKNNLELKQQLDSTLLTIEKSTIQIYTSIKAEKQLQKSQNQKKKAKEGEIDQKALVRSRIFEESVLSALLNEQINKISFDGDLSKVQEFKKLKKPQESLEQQAKLKEKQANPEYRRKDGIVEELNEPEEKDLEKAENIPKQPGSQPIVQKNQSKNKYEAFLLSRIVLLPNQRYIQSYVCGLAYNIILSGRIYITNQRLCFYSKFNPKNLFFGETFIEIPKKDIKKIEKRQNALVFDNSISITTVNGQMFFTSFFSRNQAYNQIVSALELCLQEIMYVPQEVHEIAIQQEVIGQQQDDIKQEVLPQRAKSIDELLKKVEYRQLANTKFKFKDFTALKFFKLFQLDQEINYNRGKHQGFQGYFKKLSGHTQVVTSEWQPNILQYFNSSNIKAETPLVFKRTINQVVPVVNSGIPFMPKTSQIQERASVYFYSKDKIVIETQVKSSGVPYCDYFVINYKKEVTTAEQNTVAFKMYYNITFITNTMMKGVIQTRSFEESQVTMKKTEEEMNKYIKFLEKATAKAAPSNLKSQKEIQQSPKGSAEVEQLNVELQEYKKQNEALNVQMSDQKNSHLKTKKILIVSVLLNIVLLLVLMI